MANMERGEVFIDQVQILARQGFPRRYVLHMKGSLPTPCHRLRTHTNQPDKQNRIQVEVYSLVNPEEMCAQVLEPFETSLQLGSFPEGRYQVFVNEELAGEILAP